MISRELLTESRPWCSGQVTETPSPRCSHAAAVVQGGDCLVLFGGYGGHGSHSRQDLNDLLCFHFATCEWYAVETLGSPPQARSGHAMVASKSSEGRESLYVMGGWNSAHQFDDVFLLENDGDSLTWSTVSTCSGPSNWGPRRWNFGAVSVKSVPNWKVNFKMPTLNIVIFPHVLFPHVS